MKMIVVVVFVVVTCVVFCLCCLCCCCLCCLFYLQSHFRHLGVGCLDPQLLVEYNDDDERIWWLCSWWATPGSGWFPIGERARIVSLVVVSGVVVFVVVVIDDDERIWWLCSRWATPGSGWFPRGERARIGKTPNGRLQAVTSPTN